jgi:hypothetical protein
MTPADDIDDKSASSQTKRHGTRPTAGRLRSVGPESEVRGGSEAPEADLNHADEAGMDADKAEDKV